MKYRQYTKSPIYPYMKNMVRLAFPFLITAIIIAVLPQFCKINRVDAFIGSMILGVVGCSFLVIPLSWAMRSETKEILAELKEKKVTEPNKKMTVIAMNKAYFDRILKNKQITNNNIADQNKIAFLRILDKYDPLVWHAPQEENCLYTVKFTNIDLFALVIYNFIMYNQEKETFLIHGDDDMKDALAIAAFIQYCVLGTWTDDIEQATSTREINDDLYHALVCIWTDSFKK